MVRALRGRLRVIEVRRDDAIATVTLDRARRLNALTVDGWEQLGEVVHDLNGDAALRAVVFRGDGARAFSTGIDVDELGAMTASEVQRAMTVVEETLLRIEHLPMPTVAVLRGWVLGAGCELALACDLRLATPDVRLGLPMARLGLMPSSRLLKRVVEHLGQALTKELIFTGGHLDAREAADLRLLRQVGPDELDGVLGRLLEQMARNSFGALKAAKRAAALSSPLPVSYGTSGFSYYVDPDDFPASLLEFLRQRVPADGGTRE